MTSTMAEIKKIIRDAEKEAYPGGKPPIEPAFAGKVKWPINCIVGPGLEGAIAAETRIGYVNGSSGSLIYQGYDVFDLCENSTFEEVTYLLLNGHLPSKQQFEAFNKKLVEYRYLPNTLRRLMGMPLEDMHPMAALRLGNEFMRQRLSWRDSNLANADEIGQMIASDEDSIAMETMPKGEKHAIYEFRQRNRAKPDGVWKRDNAESMDSCMHLVSGLATIAAAIARLREEKLPIEPDPELSHAGNLLYMMSGKRPTKEEERVMDIILILHADHGMNASTFAAMVVASTLSDFYLSVGAGIAALTGPLHGGANEHVLRTLEKIGSAKNVESWVSKELKNGRKVPGFGHRVYKTYDPRALVLGPLAKHLADSYESVLPLFKIAEKLESTVIEKLGAEKKIFPNVDFYSGLVYKCLGVPVEMFTVMFAVSRVSGWTARVHEYLQNNRIFRPRAMYIGELGKKYTPMSKRS